MSVVEEVSREHEQDMTPMIDVVFLLIIFFLCIDFRVLEAKLPAYLPRHGSGAEATAPVQRLHVGILCTARVRSRRRRSVSWTHHHQSGRLAVGLRRHV